MNCETTGYSSIATDREIASNDKFGNFGFIDAPISMIRRLVKCLAIYIDDNKEQFNILKLCRVILK